MNESADAEAIEIVGWNVQARVGVPEEERARPQRLSLSLKLTLRRSFATLNDRIAETVDYAALCDDLKRFIATREDKLIETLADALASHLLASYPLARVEVEVRKFILPDVEHVAVRVARSRSAAP